MEKLITLFEISSSDFRNKIKSLGYTENNNELTSGGDLNPQFLDILSSVLDEWKKSNPNCPLKFTSGNDTFHKTKKSLHTVGLAVDVTLNTGCKSNFLSLLNLYKTKYNGFSYIDEYAHPSPGSTGGHIHISFKNGAPESTDTNYSSPELGSTSGDTQTDLFGSFLDAGIKSLGFQNESKLEKNINKIKKLLK
jgi:hypothetical protein